MKHTCRHIGILSVFMFSLFLHFLAIVQPYFSLTLDQDRLFNLIKLSLSIRVK